MKARTLSVLAGVSAPLIAAGTAQAGFVDLTVDEQVVNIVDDPVVGTLDLTVFTLIANFDTMGDQLIAVAGTPSNPLSISVTSGGFWNHPLVGNVAPAAGTVGFSPAALWDSFVDIGQEVNNGSDPTLTPPGNFPPGLGGTDAGVLQLGGAQDANSNGIPDGEETAWARTPDDTLTEAFGGSTFPGAGSVIVGRFSVLSGGAAGAPDIEGGFVIQDGEGVQHVVSFTSIPGPGTLALIGMAGLVGCRRRRR